MRAVVISCCILVFSAGRLAGQKVRVDCQPLKQYTSLKKVFNPADRCDDGGNSYEIILEDPGGDYPEIQNNKMTLNCPVIKGSVLNFFSTYYQAKGGCPVSSFASFQEPLMLSDPDSSAMTQLAEFCNSNGYGILLREGRIDLLEADVGKFSELRYVRNDTIFLDLFYDRDFFNSTQDPKLLETVLYHEMGHFHAAHGHSNNPKSQELDADFYSGEQMAKEYYPDELTFDQFKAEILEVLFQDYSEVSESHPIKADRILAFQQGWNSVKEYKDQDRSDELKDFQLRYDTISSSFIEYQKKIDALMELLEDVDDDPLKSRILKSLGEYSFIERQYDECQNHLRNFLQIQGNTGDFEVQLLRAKAIFYFNGKSINNTSKNYLNNIVRNANSNSLKGEAHYYFGLDDAGKDNYNSAVKSFKSSIELEPFFTLSYFELCKIHYDQKDYYQTLNEAIKGIEIEKAQTTHLNRIDSFNYYLVNSVKKLREISLTANNPIPLINIKNTVGLNPLLLEGIDKDMGSIYEKIGDYPKAEQSYLEEKARDQDFDLRTRYKSMGRACFDRGEFRLAYEYLRKAEDHGFEHLYSGYESGKKADLFQLYQDVDVSGFSNNFKIYYAVLLYEREEACLAFDQYRTLTETRINYPSNRRVRDPNLGQLMRRHYYGNKKIGTNRERRFRDKMSSADGQKQVCKKFCAPANCH